jgi:hypothetical protein
MTELLERALAKPSKRIAKLKTLSASEQDALASMILEELEDDMRWDKAFSRSPGALAKLAAPAMAEYHAGKTQELDPETL